MGSMRKAKDLGFRNLSFAKLVEEDPELAQIRHKYASCTAEERRNATDWSYYSSVANDLLSDALHRGGQENPLQEDWPPGIVALAIDPTFPPAMLTVGSMEYQMGRKEEAMALFRAMLELGADAPDLQETIDEAATFLIQQNDADSARSLYEAACKKYPKNTVFLNGMSYSLSKLGLMEEAIAVQREAVSLDPENPTMPSDLGWTLVENEQYKEAEQVLKKAVNLSPPDYERPLNNLNELRRRMGMGAT